MNWNFEIETVARAVLEKLQNDRLQKLTNYVYNRVPMYRRVMDSVRVKPTDIRSVHDLHKLPFTTKNDLRDNYPFGLFAVPMNQVARVHASSGTTGKPTVVGYTKNDIALWTEIGARCFAMSGAKPGEVFQNATGYGLFTGGLGFHYAAEGFGCNVVPTGVGNTARQIMLLQDFQAAIIATTPSYALTLADEILRSGVDPKSLKARIFLLGGEPWTEQMRIGLEEKLGIHAINIYGLSEIMGPFVSNECVEAKAGMHIAEDHFLTEVINPLTGELVADGEVGEIVFTTLTKEAMPLLRYRTGDLCHLTRERCICGRTHARMSRILGRTDDMLIIRGVNVFPSQIEAVLVGQDHLSPHYAIIITRKGYLDAIEVQIEVQESFYRDLGAVRFSNVADDTMLHLRTRIHKTLHDALGLNVEVTLLAPGQALRSEGGKLKRVFDRRS